MWPNSEVFNAQAKPTIFVSLQRGRALGGCAPPSSRDLCAIVRTKDFPFRIQHAVCGERLKNLISSKHYLILLIALNFGIKIVFQKLLMSIVLISSTRKRLRNYLTYLGCIQQLFM